MPRRRVILVLSVFSLFASSVIGLVTPVRAQTGIDSANSEAERAADAVGSAYEIVDAATSERDAIEDELFEALDRYSVNADRLSELGTQLTRLDDSLAIAEARTLSTRDLFESQAVAAYIQAVSSEGTVILHSGSVERAMVAGETLRRSSNETLSALDRYLTFSQELGSIREQISSQRMATDAARQQLEADSAELERLFTAANEAVANAFDQARQAEADLARAVDEVRAAELAEAERRREEEASVRSTTTSTPPTTAVPPRSHIHIHHIHIHVYAIHLDDYDDDSVDDNNGAATVGVATDPDQFGGPGMASSPRTALCCRSGAGFDGDHSVREHR